MSAQASLSSGYWRDGQENEWPTRPVTGAALRRQNLAFRGTGGVSAGNCDCGFAPAFLDRDTGVIYLACFADGRPAPVHLLDGLPADVIIERDGAGRNLAAKSSLLAGFVRAGLFYTREQAAQSVLG